MSLNSYLNSIKQWDDICLDSYESLYTYRKESKF